MPSKPSELRREARAIRQTVLHLNDYLVALRKCEQILKDNRSRVFPVPDLHSVEAAVCYLDDLGMTGDGELLLIMAQNVFVNGTNLQLTDMAKGRSPEEQQSLAHVCGKYPRPCADDQQHQEYLQASLKVLVGEVRGTIAYADRLLRKVQNLQDELADEEQEGGAKKGKPRGPEPKFSKERTVEVVERWEREKSTLKTFQAFVEKHGKDFLPKYAGSVKALERTLARHRWEESKARRQRVAK